MEIELARPDHLAVVQACVEAAYRPYVERIGTPPAPMTADYEQLIERGVVHVAVEAGKVVGLIVMTDEGDHLYVDNVAVDPAAQRRGVGRQLLAEADRVARQAGRSEIRLYLNAKMTENLAFYARLGFVETRRGRVGPFERVFLTRTIAP